MKSITDDATLRICIQNEDFVLDNQNLISQLTPMISSFYSSSAQKYILPSTITNTSFEQFLNIVNHYNEYDNTFINSLSISSLLSIINIAILMNAHKIVDLLSLNVKERISLHTIIDILISFYPINK